MRYAVLVVALATATGCFGPDGSGDGDGGGDDAPPTPDAPPDVGCEATSPRTTPIDTVFTGPTGLETRMIQHIASATSSLDVHMYLFTTDTIADALIAAHGRGVAVRVILDDHPGNPDVKARLVAAGIETRDAPSGYPYAHAKYMIIDHATSVILSGNFNYTSMAFERNYGTVDRDAGDIADLQAVFDADWTGAAQPDLSCSRLVVSPINARGRIVQMINQATTTLDVEIMYLSETNVRASILQANTRGVAVRVLLANPADYEDNVSTIATLRNAGIAVKTATTFDVHAKLIIADGKAFVGSQNMSSSALSLNREVGVVVFEPGPAQTAIDQFAADWTTATDPP
jgi:phosphatidylserine/phosphatidylglycerophosphate/cardiolipin synthase-like enzyme